MNSALRMQEIVELLTGGQHLEQWWPQTIKTYIHTCIQEVRKCPHFN
jgi:hypothetical protein